MQMNLRRLKDAKKLLVQGVGATRPELWELVYEGIFPLNMETKRTCLNMTSEIMQQSYRNMQIYQG
jgi:hypothetical protein